MATDLQPLIDAVRTSEGIDRAGVALVSVVMSVLAACGTASVSEGITDAGTASRLVFPDAQTQASLPAGSWPALDDLRQVQPGMDKDRLRMLLGRPHFGEGMFNVREWDYIFNFEGATAGSPVTCHYKVIFDKDALAGSIHWLPANCGERYVAQTQSTRPVSVTTTARPLLTAANSSEAELHQGAPAASSMP